MSTTCQTLLAWARDEIGTADTGKYNRAYYGYDSSAAWCAAFIWWLFQQAGASQLYYGGGKTAYCPILLNYHRARGQAVSDYQPGDVIFFDFNGNGIPDHVGLCESCGGNNITTIDGNTSLTSQASGGQVMRRTRNKKYICGAYRPAYEEEIDLTEEQVRAIVKEELSALQTETDKQEPSDWAAQAWQRAKETQLLDGTRPRAAMTREMMAVVEPRIEQRVAQAVLEAMDRA